MTRYLYIPLLILLNGCSTSCEDEFKKGVALYKSADQECYFDEKTLKEAMEHLENALALGCSRHELFDKLARAYEFPYQKDKDLERVYSAGLDHYPNDIAFYYGRGECRKRQHKFTLAFDDFDKAIRLDPEKKHQLTVYTYYGRGAMLHKMGDTLKARSDFKTACEINQGLMRDYADYCRSF